MLKRWLFYVGWGLLLAACGQNASPTATPAQAPSLRVTVSEALAFASPSREAEVLFRLVEGDQVPILARTEADAFGQPWYQIGRGELFGWVVGSQVSVSGDIANLRLVALQVPTLERPLSAPDDLPLIITATPIRVGLSEPQGTVSTETALYDLPRDDAPEVGRLIVGELVDLLGKTSASPADFYFVGQDGFILGWVAAADLVTSGDLNQVAVLSDADQSMTELLGLPTQAAQVASFSPEADPASANLSLNGTNEDETLTASLTPRATAPPTATPRFSPTPSPPLDLASTAQAAPSATPFQDQSAPTATPPPVEIQEGPPPPISLTAPDGWRAAYVLIPINSEIFRGTLPVAVYEGPLVGGLKGTLWVIWAFPNVTNPRGEINLFGDGLQLLRGVLLDAESCNLGVGEQRIVMIGGQQAEGTIFSAEGCEDTPDTGGQFGVLQYEGGNFAFFVSIEPLRNVDLGLPQMQQILDSIRFLDLE